MSEEMVTPYRNPKTASWTMKKYNTNRRPISSPASGMVAAEIARREGDHERSGQSYDCTATAYRLRTSYAASHETLDAPHTSAGQRNDCDRIAHGLDLQAWRRGTMIADPTISIRQTAVLQDSPSIRRDPLNLNTARGNAAGAYTRQPVVHPLEPRLTRTASVSHTVRQVEGMAYLSLRMVFMSEFIAESRRTRRFRRASCRPGPSNILPHNSRAKRSGRPATRSATVGVPPSTQKSPHGFHTTSFA